MTIKKKKIQSETTQTEGNTTTEGDTILPSNSQGDIIPDKLRTEMLDELKRYMEEKMESKQLKLLEVLGIYISLFTFISASIQVFARISDLFSAILVLLIILICLIIFLVLIHIVLFRSRQTGNSEKKKWWERISFDEILLAICFLFLLAIFTVGFGLNKKFNPLPSNIEFAEEFEKWTDEKVNEKFSNYTTTTNNLINNLGGRINSIEGTLK
ncbi:MAG: hypothetical protein V1819_00825 [bacterium]